MSSRTIAVLIAARRVADLAEADGALRDTGALRPASCHMGAVLADAVLQAGLNYASVVRPRVAAILHRYPTATRVSTVMDVVQAGQAASFLSWGHETKVDRFERLVRFLVCRSVDTAVDLRSSLECETFRADLQELRGIGPKTVDYLACLVGLDSIAVDRHVRAYAFRAGVSAHDYDFLREVFCGAADLLSVSRRSLDAWIWRRESSGSGQRQLALPI